MALKNLQLFHPGRSEMVYQQRQATPMRAPPTAMSRNISKSAETLAGSTKCESLNLIVMIFLLLNVSFQVIVISFLTLHGSRYFSILYTGTDLNWSRRSSFTLGSSSYTGKHTINIDNKRTFDILKLSWKIFLHISVSITLYRFWSAA